LIRIGRGEAPLLRSKEARQRGKGKTVTAGVVYPKRREGREGDFKERKATEQAALSLQKEED